MTTISVEDHLKSYRSQHGEEAWRAEVQRLALAALRTHSDKAAAFWKALTKDYDWLDWGQLETQAQSMSLPPSTERLIAETLKAQLPGLKSQAQYDAVVGTMEAVQLVVNALLERDTTREQDARNMLELSFDAIKKTTDATLKLEDVPEAASTDTARQFKEAPAQFQEVDLQAGLLQDLALINDSNALKAWYEATRDKRDKIVTQSLRNELLDAIRARRKSLT